MKKFDAIIIGSGQGGIPLAKALAKEGWKTAIIEKEYAGGTCINYGCTPTKTMISCAKTAYNIRHGKEWGIYTNDFSIDIHAIIDFKERVVASSRNGLHNSLTTTDNLEYIEGVASFTGLKQLTVDLNNGVKEQLTADKIFIDTGTSPLIPGIKGLKEVEYYTSQTLMELREIPKHLVIIGGSYVALEFGQMYKRFGSKVTVLERGKEFLSREDRDVAACLQQVLEEEHIHIHTGIAVIDVENVQGEVKINFETNGKTSSVQASHLLVATGRSPNTKTLNLPATNVDTDEHGFIKVNDKLETSADGIYAIGDVNGEPQFTHISYNDFVILKKNLLEDKNESTLKRPVPYCMFTDPQFGRIGMSEADAEKQNLNYKTATISMNHVARARETNHTKGMMKAVVDADTKTILGAAVIGEEGGEIMAVLQMAMHANIPYTQLAEMIFAHPTYAEAINNLFLPLIQ